MARRADAARKKMKKVAAALPKAGEVAKIVKLGYSAGLKLNNKKALLTAAKGIASTSLALIAKYDGSTFGAVDPMIPNESKYKGKPPE